MKTSIYKAIDATDKEALAKEIERVNQARNVTVTAQEKYTIGNTCMFFFTGPWDQLDSLGRFCERISRKEVGNGKKK